LVVQDADDLSLPNRLASSVETMNARPELAMAAGQCFFESRRGHRRPAPRLPTAVDEVRRYLRRGVMPLCHPAAIIRSTAFHAVGGYDEFLLRAQDLSLAMRLAAVGGIVGLDDVMVVYRHPRVLSFPYWRESRQYRKLAYERARQAVDWRDLLDPYLPAWRPYESLLYPAAMLRRVVSFNR
jgi:GT2 family glycosyltransferase